MASASQDQPLRSWVSGIATPRGSATTRTGNLTPRTPGHQPVAGTPRQLAYAALAGEALAGTPLLKAFSGAAARENMSEGARPPKTRVSTSKRAMFGRDATSRVNHGNRHPTRGAGARKAGKAAPEEASMAIETPLSEDSSLNPPARKRLRLQNPPAQKRQRLATPRGTAAASQTASSWAQPIGASCLACGGGLAEIQGGEDGEMMFSCPKCRIASRVAH